MAVPKKGWRKITLENRFFYWRTIGTDWGITLVVVTEAAFVPNKTSQQLRVTFEYDQLQTPIAPGVVSLTQRAVISPRVVRFAIERAMAMKPPFTGEIGASDIVLTTEMREELQQQARIAQHKLL